MRYIAVLALSLATLNSDAQNLDVFWQKRCNFSTTGAGKSQGLKVKFTVPCDWKEMPVKEKNKSIKSFQFEDEKNEVVVINMFNVSKPKEPMTEQRLNEMVTAEGNKKSAEKGLKFISGRRLKIDGAEAVEILSKMEKKVMFMSVTMYTLQYSIVHKDQNVNVMYVLTGEDETSIKKVYPLYRPLLEKLATATDILE